MRTRLRHLPWSLAVVVALAIVPLAGAQASSALATSTLAHVWSEPASGYDFLDAAVASARTSLDLSMYELNDPVFERALVASARRGVVVRVLLNAAFLGLRENTAAAARLRAGSVQVVWAPTNQIFHAKYMVVDGARAYIGSGNLVAADYATTRDFWVEDTNANDVDAVSATFASDFAHRVGKRRASHGLVWSPGSAAALVTLIDSAHRTLLVENEEMKSAPIEQALVAAAHRGVHVDVVMTYDSSWTSALTQLARHGVQVRLHRGAQVYIHAKVICADCTASSGTVFIGSENFSTSSLSYNRELGVTSATPAARDAVRSAVNADFASGTALGVASSPPTTSLATATTGSTLTITSLTASVARGEYVSLSAHDVANAACSLSVTLPSGRVSTAQGLGAQLASSSGALNWRWEIGPTTDPGSATATVRCAGASLARHFSIT